MSGIEPGALGVDVGGTFTDLAHWDGSLLRTGKTPSTLDQSDGVMSGAQALEVIAARLLHGTTVATNALIERKGARTALVTTEGFGDVIEIGRQDRPSLYDAMADRPAPLVPRSRRFGVPRDDGPWTPPSELGDAEAIAVSLLYAYADPDPENGVRRVLEAEFPRAAISISSEVVAEFREYERTSTTVLNAYLKPVVARYLEQLIRRTTGAGLGEVAVMRSSGGLISGEEAARLPAAILLSGPAGGVVASAALGEALGQDRLISFDMGGTSTDVCRIEGGRPEISYERDIEGFACRMPSTAIHTVGAGGGSLGWVDEGGSLRVGPQSAGADPGPACYGGGGMEAAMTDANLVLGRIDPEARLGGTLALQPALAAAALERLGVGIGFDGARTANGMVTVVEEIMAGAIRRVSLEQGADPRESTLVAFGGAGGLHAAALARNLDMAGVVIPPYSGVFSALGLLLSSPRADVARSVMLAEPEWDRLGVVITELRDAAATRLQATSGTTVDRTVSLVETRYRGQSHEIPVPLEAGDAWGQLAARFHRLHEERNGFARPTDPIEAVTVRAEAVGRPLLRWSDLPEVAPRGGAHRPTRLVLVPEGEVDAAVWWRPGLAPGAEVIGPAVIEETDATTYLGAGERAVVLPGGALEVEW